MGRAGEPGRKPTWRFQKTDTIFKDRGSRKQRAVPTTGNQPHMSAEQKNLRRQNRRSSQYDRSSVREPTAAEAALETARNHSPLREASFSAVRRRLQGLLI